MCTVRTHARTHACTHARMHARTHARTRVRTDKHSSSFALSHVHDTTTQMFNHKAFKALKNSMAIEPDIVRLFRSALVMRIATYRYSEILYKNSMAIEPDIIRLFRSALVMQIYI